jgi:hypothetical protein
MYAKSIKDSLISLYTPEPWIYEIKKLKTFPWIYFDILYTNKFKENFYEIFHYLFIID